MPNLDIVPGQLFLTLVVLLGCQLLSIKLALDVLLPGEETQRIDKKKKS
jgi:hypothetical protein